MSARSGLGQPRRVAKLAASLDAAEACLAPDPVAPPAPPPGPTNKRPQMRSATPALDLLKEKLKGADGIIEAAKTMLQEKVTMGDAEWRSEDLAELKKTTISDTKAINTYVNIVRTFAPKK